MPPIRSSLAAIALAVAIACTSFGEGPTAKLLIRHPGGWVKAEVWAGDKLLASRWAYSAVAREFVIEYMPDEGVPAATLTIRVTRP